MTIKQPFYPAYGTNVDVAVTNVAQTVALFKYSKQVRLVNAGPNKVYVRTFDSRNGASVASNKDAVVAPGMASVFTKNAEHDSLSIVAPGGTADVDVISGEGF